PAFGDSTTSNRREVAVCVALPRE
ncbi:MAG: hypothetical protein K0Q72_2615, partial [Armatimonadetes bacterium]|nr:hypothetical protein [Armatimonadota bacterium]